MKLQGRMPLAATAALCLMVISYSCSKSSGVTTPQDPCKTVNISVTATWDSSSVCENSGSITATGSGASGLQYSVDGGAYQTSGSFDKLAKGAHTVTVKTTAGCTASASVSIAEQSATPGPTFSAVKALMAAKCVSCHNPAGQQPNPNWTVDCNIVNNANAIKTRAVDQGTMPPTGALAQSDKDIITAWINAGGKFKN
jgi:mono/diheme cytochrome c family protein